MMSTMIWLVLLILHILCCVLVYLGIRSHVLKVKKAMMPLVIFVPLWGPACVLCIHFQIFIDADQTKEVGVERMKVNDEIYKSVFVESTEGDKNVVPLEEALIINDPVLRRNLILDVLNDNPEEYIELLQQARMNEDVEVVHYASTAMAELAKEYDIRLQKLEQTYASHSDDAGALAAYCDFLGDYIDQGMVQGQMLLLQRNQYGELLKKIAEKDQDSGIYERMVENDLELENYTEAGRNLEFMTQKWPDRENTWLLWIRYYASQKQGAKLETIIQEMRRRHVYLSSRGKEILAFWRPEKGNAV